MLFILRDVYLHAYWKCKKITIINVKMSGLKFSVEQQFASYSI